jgi:hypothetical protein
MDNSEKGLIYWTIGLITSSIVSSILIAFDFNTLLFLFNVPFILISYRFLKSYLPLYDWTDPKVRMPEHSVTVLVFAKKEGYFAAEYCPLRGVWKKYTEGEVAKEEVTRWKYIEGPRYKG